MRPELREMGWGVRGLMSTGWMIDCSLAYLASKQAS